MEKKSEATSHSTNTLTDNLRQLNLSFKILFSQLKLGKQLGEGGFGVVYQATHLHAEVAFKQLKFKEIDEQAKTEWLQETKIMAQLRSPFIVQFFGVCTEPDHYGIVMEYCPKGSLYSVLKSDEPLDWTRRYQLALDIGKGVTCLHANKIIHRDLKSLNVLLDNQYRAKLCDFGLAKIKTQTANTSTLSFKGTMGWAAPELLEEKPAYTPKSDIYSYGMVLWEIASRKIPFKDLSPLQISRKLDKGGREVIPPETPAIFQQMIEMCWDSEPEKRPTASQVVERLQLGCETFQLQSKPTYPDNLSSQINKLPSLLINPLLPSAPQYLDNFLSVDKSTPFEQTVTLESQYFDNFASQAKASSIATSSQYLPKVDISSMVDMQTTLSNPQSLAPNETDASMSILLSNVESSKSTLPLLNMENTPENLIQAAQLLIRGRNWTLTQKTYFQTLIETLSLPPIQTWVGHSHFISSLLLLPSGEVVSGSSDKTLKVWDLKTGQCIKTLTDSSEVTRLLSLPNGRVVSGSSDKTLKIWNIKTGECVKILTGHTRYVTSLLLLPSEEMISSYDGKMLKIWDINTGECVKTLTGFSSYMENLLFLPSGEMMCSSDKMLEVWDIKTGTCVKTLRGHREQVTSLLLLSNGEVVSGSWDTELKVWDIKTGECVKTLQGHSWYVTSLLLLPSGEVVSGSGDKTLKVWDMKTGQCMKTLIGHTDYIYTLRLISDTCFVSSANGEIKRWNLSNYTCEHTYERGAIRNLLPISSTEGLLTSGTTIERITWQPYALLSQALTQSTLSLTASTYTFFKKNIERQGKRLSRTLIRSDFNIDSLLLLPSGEVVGGCYDGKLKVWDIKTGKCMRTLTGHEHTVNCLLLLLSGEVVSGSWDKTLKVWDMKTGQCVKTLKGLLTGHSESVTSLLLLPSGEVVSGSADKTLKVWDMKTSFLNSIKGAWMKTIKGHEDSVNSLLLLPSGKVVSGSGDKTLKMWDMKTGTCVKTLTGHEGPVNCLLLLPNGEVVSGSYDKTLKIWNIETSECVKTLMGHEGSVNCLLLLPSGEVVSGACDNTLKVWNIKTGECMKTLTGHESYVTSLLLLPSGEVASSSADHTFKVWDIHLEKTLEELETQAPECKQM